MTFYHALRALAIIIGCALTGVEVLGAHEYLTAQHASDYLIRGGCIAIAATASIPLLASMCRHNGQRVLAQAISWMIVPVVYFVLTSAIARTGGAVDRVASDRQKAEISVANAAKTERETEKQLEIDRVTVGSICSDYGWGSKKCTRAQDAQKATQARLDTARAEKVKIIQDDPAIRRLAAILPISEEKIRLYQPLLLPCIIGILAYLFMAAGAHSARHRPRPNPPKPVEKPTPAKKRGRGRPQGPAKSVLVPKGNVLPFSATPGKSLN